MKKKTGLFLIFTFLLVFFSSIPLLAADTVEVTIQVGSPTENGKSIAVDIFATGGEKVTRVSGETKITVAPGTYTYTGYLNDSTTTVGSGRFTVTGEAGQTVRLKNVVFPTPTSSNIPHKNHVWSEDKSYEYESGSNTRSFLLPAIGGAGHYLYAYLPDDTETYWGSNGELYVYYGNGRADSFMSLNLSDGGSFVVAKKVTITVKVPHGATFDIYNRVKFYRPLEEMVKYGPQSEGEYDVYTIEVPDKSNGLHYRLEMEGKVTKARMVNSQDYASTPLVIDESDLADDPKQVLRDSSQSFYDASLLMNVNDAGCLAMNDGDTFDLRCYRNWQAISSETGNYHVEPDYHYTVAEGDSVTVDSSGRITAVKPGVSVVHVTYDALDWVSSGNKAMIYSAIYPENTGTIVVNVNSDRSAGIKMNINRSSEYDTIYYTRSINGVVQEKQYAEYTFKPTADQDISVRVQKPLTTDWSEGWESYTANSDGSFTVKLRDGRNIIEVKAGNSVEYWVLRAYGLDLSIVNSNTGAAIGDTVPLDTPVDITFHGITSPLAKLGAVYNPGFPDGIYVVYDHDGQTLEGTHTQYALKTTNTLHINCDESGTYQLTGGTIHGNVIGGSGGMHRALTLGGNTGNDSSYESDGMAGISFDGYLSVLPDISIEVVGKKDEAAIAALSFCKITHLKNANPSIKLGGDTVTAVRTSTLDDTLMQVMTSDVNSSSASKRSLSYTVKSDNPTQIKMFLRYWTENNPTPTLIPVTQNLTATTSKFSKYDDVTYAELILVPDVSAKAYNKTYTLRVSSASETETNQTNPLYGKTAYLIGLDIVPIDGLAQYSTLHGLLKADPITYTDGNGDSQTLDLGYGFLGTELNYTTTVPYATSEIQLIPTALVEGDAVPVISVNGETVESGSLSQTIDLTEGNNQITIENSTGSDTRAYTVNVVREYGPQTVSFSGQSGLTVVAFDDEGDKYSQNGDGTMSIAPGSYTYYASAPGYLTKSGSFTVTAEGSNNVSVGNLTAVPPQSGKVSVAITDDDTVLRHTDITVSDAPADLAKEKYVDYNNGGYTALHAVIDALNSGNTSLNFTCKKGILTPDTAISATGQGVNAGWICEVNGRSVKAASTLVYSGDKVAYYYNPDYNGMLHASFDTVAKTVKAGNSVSFTLKATSVANDGSAAAVVANAALYVNGKDSGITTDSNGKATLSAFPAAGRYTVTAVKTNDNGDNILTFSRCLVTATKPAAGGTSTTVTFRLIGDSQHSSGVNGHEHYVNWISTRSYSFDSDTVTIYDVFTRAMAGADLSYIGAEDNYVSTITAPITEGGYDLSEKENGINSGWMYTVNGDHPDQGLKVQTVEDGDVIVWHYVDDYLLETEFESTEGVIYLDRWLEADDTEAPYITANIAIYELPGVSKLTLEDESAVEEARSLYDSLDDTEKDYISVDRLEKLLSCEDQIKLMNENQPAAQVVIDQIAALPALDQLTLLDKIDVVAARSAYGALTLVQQKLVTNLDTLTAAETKIAALEEGATNQEEAQKVIDLITALPATDQLTLEDKTAVEAARAAYDTLTKVQQGLVTNLDTLKAAEAKIAALEEGATSQEGAQRVMDQIAALPALDQLTLSNKAAVAAARAAYDSLTEAQKSLVTNYSALTAAEAKIAALAATPVTDVKNMKDIPDKAWYYQAVSFVLAQGIMKGTSATSFDPDSAVTRGQFVTILGRYAGISDSSAANPAVTQFTDVKTTAYYSAHVAWAAEKGITTGTSTTTFAPDAKISRQDMAVMLARFAKVMEIDLPDGSGVTAFADDNDIAGYAKTAVYSMVKANIISGVGGNQFAPKNNATRAQAAKMISLLVQYGD
ncbi:MAG TPA: S-layer homology domain-containing protein [Clostridiales bacterium]|nr:S-layer homology domain-containing protein [Clostridiales bacterium]